VKATAIRIPLARAAVTVVILPFAEHELAARVITPVAMSVAWRIVFHITIARTSLAVAYGVVECEAIVVRRVIELLFGEPQISLEIVVLVAQPLDLRIQPPAIVDDGTNGKH